MKNPNTRIKQAEPTDEAIWQKGPATLVAFNRDTRSSEDQQNASIHVVARASRISIKSLYKLIGSTLSQRPIKKSDIVCEPLSTDVYTFGISDSTHNASKQAIESLEEELQFTGELIKIPVSDIVNAMILGGEQADGKSRIYLVVLQAVSKQALESFLNIELAVTSYDSWSKKTQADAVN